MSRRRSRERPSTASRGPFAVECPGCREPVAVTGDLVGRVAGCPRCRATFVVPDPDGGERAQDVARPPRREREAVTVETAAPEVPSPAASDEPLVFSEPPLPASRMRRMKDAAVSTSVSAPQSPATIASESDGATLAAAGVEPIHVAAPDSADEPPDTDSPVQPPEASAGQASLPDAADGDMAFRDPVKTVRSGGTEIELRRLTPEEKRARRTRRNLLLMLVGAALLVTLVVILGTRGR